jgi:hypothetical protein
MIEVSELVRSGNDGSDMKDKGHCMIPLMGRFKQETGERNLIMVLANETNGSLLVRKWIDLLTGFLKAESKGDTCGYLGYECHFGLATQAENLMCMRAMVGTYTPPSEGK